MKWIVWVFFSVTIVSLHFKSHISVKTILIYKSYYFFFTELQRPKSIRTDYNIHITAVVNIGKHKSHINPMTLSHLKDKTISFFFCSICLLFLR